MQLSRFAGSEFWGFGFMRMLFAVVGLGLQLTKSQKLRSWLGPDHLGSGTLPSPRLSTGYAVVNDQQYLFGGFSGAGVLNDMHRFDRARLQWTLIPSNAVKGTVPPARTSFGFVSVHGKLYVFAGWAGMLLAFMNDFHQFDPSTLAWTALDRDIVEGQPPSKRFGLGCTSIHHTIFVFGGANEATVQFNDMFQFDTRAFIWAKVNYDNVSGTPPSPRSFVGFTSANEMLFVFGGSCDSGITSDGQPFVYPCFNDLYQFDPTALQWTSLSSATSSPPQISAGMSMVSEGNRLFIFGGVVESSVDDKNPYAGLVNDLFALDLSLLHWTLLAKGADTSPVPRAFCSLLLAHGVLFLFGGLTSGNQLLGDSHEFDLGTGQGQWSHIHLDVQGTPISGRASAGFTSAEGKLYVFGGSGFRKSLFFIMDWGTFVSPVLNDLHQFDPLTLEWTNLSNSSMVTGDAPGARAGHGCVSSGGKVFVFGGAGQPNSYKGFTWEYLNDLYQFDPLQMEWTWFGPTSVSGTPPCARDHDSMGLAAADNKLFVFGGVTQYLLFSPTPSGQNIEFLNDMHQFDLAARSWITLRPSKGTPPSGRASFGFTSIANKLFVFGGMNASGAFLNDLYQFDPVLVEWIDLNQSPLKGVAPSPRASLGFTASNRLLFVFGGSGTVPYNDLYMFDPSALQWTELSPSSVLQGAFPDPRSGHGFTFLNDKLYLFGGAASEGAVRFSDIWSIVAPAEILWSNASSTAFIDVYDWDHLVLNQEFPGILFERLILCKGVLPCVLTIDGKGDGVIRRVGNGSIVCQSTLGCKAITLQSLRVVCEQGLAVNAVVEISEAILSVMNSSFSSCSSQQDGACIQSYGAGAAVSIQSTLFENSHSARSGGAVSGVGATLNISGSIFVNCSSFLGGGAISVASFKCYGSDEILPFSVSIDGCSFEHCRCESSGGAVSVAAAMVSATVFDSFFAHCSSEVSGGAVSARESPLVTVKNSIFEINSAHGLGGGALHSQNAFLSLQGLSCIGNNALMGGGGVVFWEGEIEPEITEWCGAGSWSDTGVGSDIGSSCESFLCTPKCHLCPAGTFQTGLGMRNESSCLACGAGLFSSFQGATTCSMCAAGTYSTAHGAVDRTTCSDCMPGSYSRLGFSTCASCQVGKYSTALAGGDSLTCGACEAGTFSEVGASVCSTCARGKYSSSRGSATCTMCAAGTFSSADGETACAMCNAGYSSQLGMTACSKCAAGEHSDPGSWTCSTCVAGSMCRQVVFVADQINQRIRSISGTSTSSPSVSTLSGSGYAGFQDGSGTAAMFALPSGIAVSPDGTTVFTADQSNQRIRAVKISTRSASTLAGGGIFGFEDGVGASASFGNPTGVAAWPDRALIAIVDSYGCRIRTVETATGAVATLAGSGQVGLQDGAGIIAMFSYPEGLAVSPDGATVFVADTSNHVMRSIQASTGVVSTLAGSGLPGHQDGAGLVAMCFYPLAVAVANDGSTLFVADYSSSIRAIEVSTGNVTTLAGNKEAGFKDGIGSAAMFSVPAGLAVSQDGTSIFVTDSKNHRVRVIDVFSKMVSTIVGSNMAGFQDGFGDTAMFAYPWGVTAKCDWVLCPNQTTDNLRTQQDAEVKLGIRHVKFNHAIAVREVRRSKPDDIVRPDKGKRDGSPASLSQQLSPPAVPRGHEIASPERRILLERAETRGFCGAGNAAAYGSCVASSFKNLEIQGLPSHVMPAYPGLPFDVLVSKKDAYNQTIVTDSTSILQTQTSMNDTSSQDFTLSISGGSVVSLEYGVALFSLILKPAFSSVSRGQGISVLEHQPFIFFKGSDTQSEIGDTMQSTAVPIIFSMGGKICPSGYILALQQLKKNLLVSGSCFHCAPKTYSVYPLAGITSELPSCLNCPVGATCAGGDEVHFSLGTWLIVGGIYRLMGCPAGHQLINSIGGVFSQDVQNCVACQPNQYILDSNLSNNTCQDCPVGADCDGKSLLGKIYGSLWEANVVTGQYQLVSCPPGYEVLNSFSNGEFSYLNQACMWCLATFYCEGGAAPASACPQGLFAPPGSNASTACTEVLYVDVTVSLALSSMEFTNQKQQGFKTALALTAGQTVGHVVILTFGRRSSGDSPIQVDSEIAAKDMSAVNALRSRLDIVIFNNQLANQGLPPASLTSVTVQAHSNQNSSMEWIVVVSVLPSLAFVVVLVIIFLSLWNKPVESEDEIILKRHMCSLREQFKLTQKHGFLLSSERSSWLRRKRDLVVIQKSYLEAAARLGLQWDFDVNQFDAFCLGLECEWAFATGNPRPKSAYEAICKWLLELCKELIKPEFGSRGDKTSLGTSPLRQEERFPYFLRKISKARIWTDERNMLFQHLKRAAQEYMDRIEQLCDKRCSKLRQEVGGPALFALPSFWNDAAGDVRRQDHEKVRAVVVHPEALQEAAVDRRHKHTASSRRLFEEKVLADEEVFIAQLHRRARLVNEEFQHKIGDIGKQYADCHMNREDFVGMSGRRASLGVRRESVPRSSSSEVAIQIVSSTCRRSDSVSEESGTWGIVRRVSSAGRWLLSVHADIGFGGSDKVMEQMGGEAASQADGFASSSATDTTRVSYEYHSGLRRVDIAAAPVKTATRMREKLVEYASERAQWPLCANILDPVRCSMVCDGPAEILNVVNWYTERQAANGLSLVRVKNKFSLAADEVLGGYRDVTLCVLFIDSHGLAIIGEIQVQDREFYNLKLKVRGQASMPLVEW